MDLPLKKIKKCSNKFVLSPYTKIKIYFSPFSCHKVKKQKQKKKHKIKRHVGVYIFQYRHFKNEILIPCRTSAEYPLSNRQIKHIQSVQGNTTACYLRNSNTLSLDSSMNLDTHDCNISVAVNRRGTRCHPTRAAS